MATVLPNWGKYIRRNFKFHYQRLHPRHTTDTARIMPVTGSGTSDTTRQYQWRQTRIVLKGLLSCISLLKNYLLVLPQISPHPKIES